ncbi:hypothetical protein BDN70DRAFT_940141 [Pholiota conissans]|uniref:Uncharacterized protein n=1 Tax=Pholiota conissans TaxID=109636 RepID=A0A9P6CRG8_9AGAR|nr:hypothetical protein BDN70DRAFT_940141 [Pholiota conissans]
MIFPPFANLPLFLNASSMAGNGNINWSGWCKKLAEGFRPCMALAAISFISDGRYSNLGRISPLDITARSIGSLYSPRHKLSIGKDTGLFLTNVSIQKSFLLQYNLVMTFSAIYVTGTLLCMFGERIGALICMVMGQDEIKTNIWKDTFSFVEASEKDGQKYKTDQDDDDMYNPNSSPVKVKVVEPVRGPVACGGKIVKPLAFSTPIAGHVTHAKRDTAHPPVTNAMGLCIHSCCHHGSAVRV